MFIYGSFRGFLIKICLGIFFLVLSVLFSFVLFQKGLNFNNFIEVSYEVHNNSIFLYNIFFIGNLFFVFFGAPLYIFTIFFLIIGVKLILGINQRYIIIKFFFLIVLAILLHSLFKISGIISNAIIGDIFYNSLILYIEPYLKNNIILWFTQFVLATTSVIILLFCLNLKIKIFSMFFKKIFKILFYLLSILKIFIPTFLFKLKKTPKNYIKNYKYNIKRSEPTLKKNLNKITQLN